MRILTVWMFSAVLLAAGAVSAQAPSTSSGQAYPNKTIRIVTGGVGSNNDFWARLLARGLTPSLGQAVIVENRGGGVIVQETVAKATPDGYTLVFLSSSFWFAPLLLDNVSFDPVKDFAPITMTASTPAFLCVHPALQAKSVTELIAMAKARPGELNYGSSGAGSPPHLAAELFKFMAHANLVRVSYKGVGPAITALIGGEIQVVFGSPAAALTHIKAGRLRALAITSAQPSALLPAVPTVAASGLPGYVSVTTSGVFAPAKTPPTVIYRLNHEIARSLATAEVREQLMAIGQEAVVSTPQQFATVIKSEMTQLRKLIEAGGIKAD